VIRFNATDTPTKMGTFSQYEYPHTKERYAEIADHLGLGGNNADEKVENLIKAINELKAQIGIKETINFKKSNYLVIVSFFVSMTLGFLFSLSFSDVGVINSIWVGLFSFLEADMLYKMFEDKIFKPFSQINNEKVVEIPKNNRIE
jgi:hypothetical protein